MRVPLLALGCLLFQAANARQENIVTPLLKADTLSRPLATMIDISEPQARLLHTLPNGNKVYALPQDNMPCVVPEVKSTMPVAGRSSAGLFNYNMPVIGLRKTPLVPGTPINPMITPQGQMKSLSPLTVSPIKRVIPKKAARPVIPKPERNN